MSDTSELYALKERLLNAKRGIRRAVMSEMDRTADDVKDRMRMLAPVDTGHLRDSIAVVKMGERYQIGPVNVPYAKSQEYGARPHVIIASPGKMLAFQVGGQTIFRKQVNHPGNPAHPYVRPAGDWARQVFPDRVQVTGATMLKGERNAVIPA
jgi:hypothetical protein